MLLDLDLLLTCCVLKDYSGWKEAFGVIETANPLPESILNPLAAAL